MQTRAYVSAMRTHYMIVSDVIREMAPTMALPFNWLAASAVATGSLLLGVNIAPGMETMVWRAAGLLFLALLVLMTADLITGLYALVPSQRKEFAWERSIVEKVMMIFLVVISLVLDLVIFQVVENLPGDFAILDTGFLFITMTSLLWLVAAEIGKILQNVAKSGSVESIPPTLGLLAKQIQWMLRSMKIVDSGRSKAADGKGLERPQRWYDEITDEEVEELARFLEGRRRSPPEAVEPIEETVKNEPIDEEEPKG